MFVQNRLRPLRRWGSIPGWLVIVWEGVAFAGDMQFLSEVTAAAIAKASPVFSFVGRYVFVLGVAWLAYLVFKPDHLWPRNRQVSERPPAESESSSEGDHGAPSIRASAVTPTQLERERDQALLDLTRERDALSKELTACKVEFSHAKLRWIADRQVLSGDEDAVVDVVVRFATPDDHFIAKNIQDIIQRHAGWSVTLNGSNDPPIEPNNEFKVLFESDLGKTFDEIADAFKYGNLLNYYSVGVSRRHDVLKDRRHLVVVVTPAVMQ